MKLLTSGDDGSTSVSVNGTEFKVTKRYFKYQYGSKKIVQCDEVDGHFEECESSKVKNET